MYWICYPSKPYYNIGEYSMGRLDIAMKELMNDYNVFADTFNFRRAEGKKILPSSLREMDPSAYVSDVLGGVSSAQSSDIARQLVVRGDESRTCALLLLENQFRSNRLMPFRYLYAAAMHWRRVVIETDRLHRKANDLKTPDDFLSGFGPDDFLPRLYMMVLYCTMSSRSRQDSIYPYHNNQKETT